jgi:predicted nucleic acid-binding protein
MNRFLLHASALAKHYAPERGSALVHHLFTRAAHDRLACLLLGGAEVVAALVRKRNSGQFTPPVFTAALARLRAEVLGAGAFQKLRAEDAVIHASLPPLERYAINSSDALMLQTALNLAVPLRASGNDLVLMSSDRRLLNAAQAERLVTLNPETQSQAELDALIGP